MFAEEEEEEEGGAVPEESWKNVCVSKAQHHQPLTTLESTIQSFASAWENMHIAEGDQYLICINNNHNFHTVKPFDVWHSQNKYANELN